MVSFKGEGEIKKEGLAPLLDTLVSGGVMSQGAEDQNVEESSWLGAGCCWDTLFSRQFVESWSGSRFTFPAHTHAMDISDISKWFDGMGRVEIKSSQTP